MTERWTVIFRSADRGGCLERRLVLDAAGIDAVVRGGHGGWLLLVAEWELGPALRELEAYEGEAESTQAAREDPVPMFGGGEWGVLGYVIVLAGVALLDRGGVLGLDWLDAGKMHAGRVMEGEWWRTITSLTLHADGGHLLANLLFGSLLGLFASQALGGGVAWLAILLAGGLGNAMNAALRDADHTAIGASTAVFAALGLLVSYAVLRRFRLPGGPVRRLSPLIGGVLLLVYTGTGGERTDVAAHVTGFLAGLAAGLAGSRLPVARLARLDVQWTAGALALAILALSWWRALA